LTYLKKVIMNTQYKPHSNKLRHDLHLGKINTVIVTELYPNKGDIFDTVYENINLANGSWMADSCSTPIFDLVSWLYFKECKSLYDVFLNYDGEVYFTDDKEFLQLTRKQLKKIELKDRPKKITLVTAY